MNTTIMFFTIWCAFDKRNVTVRSDGKSFKDVVYFVTELLSNIKIIWGLWINTILNVEDVISTYHELNVKPIKSTNWRNVIPSYQLKTLMLVQLIRFLNMGPYCTLITHL